MMMKRCRVRVFLFAHHLLDNMDDKQSLRHNKLHWRVCKRADSKTNSVGKWRNIDFGLIDQIQKWMDYFSLHLKYSSSGSSSVDMEGENVGNNLILIASLFDLARRFKLVSESVVSSNAFWLMLSLIGRKPQDLDLLWCVCCNCVMDGWLSIVKKWIWCGVRCQQLTSRVYLYIEMKCCQRMH